MREQKRGFAIFGLWILSAFTIAFGAEVGGVLGGAIATLGILAFILLPLLMLALVLRQRFRALRVFLIRLFARPIQQLTDLLGRPPDIVKTGLLGAWLTPRTMTWNNGEVKVRLDYRNNVTIEVYNESRRWLTWSDKPGKGQALTVPSMKAGYSVVGPESRWVGELDKETGRTLIWLGERDAEMRDGWLRVHWLNLHEGNLSHRHHRHALETFVGLADFMASDPDACVRRVARSLTNHQFGDHYQALQVDFMMRRRGLAPDEVAAWTSQLTDSSVLLPMVRTWESPNPVPAAEECLHSDLPAAVARGAEVLGDLGDLSHLSALHNAGQRWTSGNIEPADSQRVRTALSDARSEILRRFPNASSGGIALADATPNQGAVDVVEDSPVSTES